MTRKIHVDRDIHRIVTARQKPMATVLILDGRSFSDYAGFVAEFNRAYCRVYDGAEWDGNDFNDLDDFLEFTGTVTIRWINSEVSQIALGYEAMAAYWTTRLARCQLEFPAVQYMHQQYQQSIEEAQDKRGRTLFEYLCWQIENPKCKVVFE